MKVRLLCMGGLASVCMGIAFAALAPAASAASVKCAVIHGSGSSLQKIAQQELWDPGFATLKSGELGASSECSSYPTNTYESTSSGKGLEQWGGAGPNEGKLGTENQFPAFIGDDVGPELHQLAEMDKAGQSAAGTTNKVMAVPVAQSAVSVDVSLPEGCTIKVNSEEHPRISNQALQLAYFSSAKAANWLALIEGVTFSGGACDVKPIKLARGSASGTTCGFKRFFANLAKEPSVEKTAWQEATENVTDCTSQEKAHYPSESEVVEEGSVEGTTAKLLEKGSQLVSATFETPNMISYADLADAIATGKFLHKTEPLEHTSKVLPNGKFTSFFVEVGNEAYGTNKKGASPQKLEESNCGGVEYDAPAAVEPNQAGWSRAVELGLENGGTTNYPICTLTFDYAWNKYSSVGGSVKKYSSEEEATLANYLLYEVTLGQSGLAAKHYRGLTSSVLAEAKSGVTKAGNIEF
jgi:hypothetical protein